MLDISIDNNVFIFNELDAAIQELDILFNTENTELIGDTNYGTNWWQYLWNLTPLEENLHQYILDKINSTYYVGKFNPEVEVQHLVGTENSIYHIKITLHDNRGNELTIQQYELK